MPRGGSRDGAGRKKGAVSEQTRKRREIADKAASEGVTPLDIMLTTMRDIWAEANEGDAPNAALRLQAVAIAKDAAPYIHPKLSNVEANVSLTGHEAALDELE